MQEFASLVQVYPFYSLLFALLLGVFLSAGLLYFRQVKLLGEMREEATEKNFILQQQSDQIDIVTADKELLQEETAEQKKHIIELSRAESVLSEQVKSLHEIKQLYTQLDQSHQKSQQENVALRVQMKEQNNKMEELKNYIKQSEEVLKQQFHRMSEQVLDEKSKKFTEQNENNIQGLLKPLHKQMEDFQKLVNDNQAKRQSQHEVMKLQIEQLKDLNQNISEEANNLTRALKSESKTQGSWGELVLQRVLESSGLQLGREFETEKSFKSVDKGTYRPDVIIHLPKGKDMIIDSKVSLSAYEQFINAPESDRPGFLQQHIKSMRRHVEQLADKNYHNLPGLETLDYILMFVPIEAAYLEAMNAQPNLFEEAFKKNILILSTSNLLATLKTVSALWQNEDQNKNAIEIARQAGAMYDKFVGFVEDLSKIKQRLDEADKAWHAAENKLKSGKGNLIKKTQDLKQLGARANKMISESWNQE